MKITIPFLITLLVATAIFSSARITRAETLEKEEFIQGMVLPKGTSVIFNGSGKINYVTASEDLQVQDLPCAAHIAIGLYESGKLRYATLSKDHQIQGITCARGRQVEFYESGRLKRAYLAQEGVIQGQRLPKNAAVYFSESGLLGRENPGAGTRPARATAGIELLRKSGGLKGTLVEKQQLQGIWFEKAGVEFYESGMIKEVQPWEDITIRGISFQRFSPLLFYELGTVKQGYLTQDQQIKGVFCKGKNEVGFYENGMLRFATLAKEQTIDGTNFPAGQHLDFQNNGYVTATPEKPYPDPFKE